MKMRIVALVDENVPRLEIAINEASRVHKLEGVDELRKHELS